MSREDLIMTLGKVIVAAAWADGEVTNDEINSLKDLLFQLPHNDDNFPGYLTEMQWARLEIYLDSPVGADERARLIEELKESITTPEDKELVLSALENLVHADGVVTDEEKSFLKEIKASLEETDTGIWGALQRLIKGPVERRSAAVANAPNREEYFEEFVKNKIYYSVRQRLNQEGKELDIPEEDLRKLSLAGGLMARVAHADEEVTEDEISTMALALQTGWNISREAALLVTEIAISELSGDFDYYRLSRELSKLTTIDERTAFVNVLFTIAKADGHISPEENAEIYDIAHSLYVTKRHLNAYRESNDSSV